MNPWINATLLNIKKWTNNLFSLVLRAPIEPFLAGQFNKLALYDSTDIHKEKKIQRAYSYVNSPNEDNIEIYIRRIKNGKLSNLLYNLKVGDKVLIKKKSFGFFTLEEIPNREILWMFATGTAIGPYCSILQEEKETHRFKKIILIHAVKYKNELTYFNLMQKLSKKYNGKLIIQTIVSREKNKKSLTNRIPFLLKNKILENHLGLSINKNNSHIMLCGNPDMIKETYYFLKIDRNMNKHLRRKSGNITMENYW